ncbi:CsbD family protein [Streptomyces albireticuli]|uniref:CsbD family protein n=1 Tax=Streptomyces albireticuli TaxID=1940 RepID=A0A2A2CZ58_9ACTN|nr:CsbD family protein [Streptomyces albireticuli]MCD9141372.1 CsbD family protein [Streptomyces albireticuli]MCD9160667.1 CsbD family protein [Streptomyces albireticuli]MCD9195777.1 CsbD family protein [Streptomyces albireticuli]PAU44446.1 CsbD family protein [Streptomyces albireticuli]
MGKGKAKAKQMKGQLKESAGRAMDDKRLEAEGRGEKAVGKAQEAAEKVKRNFKH